MEECKKKKKVFDLWENLYIYKWLSKLEDIRNVLVMVFFLGS